MTCTLLIDIQKNILIISFFFSGIIINDCLPTCVVGGTITLGLLWWLFVLDMSNASLWIGSLLRSLRQALLGFRCRFVTFDLSSAIRRHRYKRRYSLRLKFWGKRSALSVQIDILDQTCPISAPENAKTQNLRSKRIQCKISGTVKYW